MESMNRNGKTYWLVDPWEHESLHKKIKAIVGHHLLNPGENTFVADMAKRSESRSFNISNPQAQWLDKILIRCGYLGLTFR